MVSYVFKEGVYRINAHPVHSYGSTAIMASSDTQGDGDSAQDLWHHRFGHAHLESIRHLHCTGAVTGITFKNHKGTRIPCKSCVKGKQTKQRLRMNNSRSMQKGAVIHTDVCGSMYVPSFSGARYFVCFVDEFSGYIVVVPMIRKSEVLDKFKWYLAWVERKFDSTVKRVHSDNGGEIIALREYLFERGIEQTMAPSYSPNLNGIAERSNRTIVESARTMLEHASLPRKFWAEAVVHAAHLRNLFPSPRQKRSTSYELMTGYKPSAAHLRVFGCLAWRHIPKELRKKLDSKSELGIVVGCLENSQYKLWIPSRKVAVITRDVTISESEFPSLDWGDELTGVAPVLLDSPSQASSSPSGSNVGNNQPNNTQGLQPQEGQPLMGTTPDLVQPTQPQQDHLENLTYIPAIQEGATIDTGNEVDQNSPVQSPEDSQTPSRYPRRDRQSPAFYQPGSAHVARNERGRHLPNDPRTVREALSMGDAVNWKEAIDLELASLQQHEPWTVMDTMPPDSKPLPTRFVFQRKYDDKGKLVRHKARLVVRGFLQGDVENKFAPVVDFTTIRTALAVAVQKGYTVHQMDVRTAFPHGRIDSDVYIRAPEGVELCKSEQVLKLRRGLYGLKLALHPDLACEMGISYEATEVCNDQR